MGISLVERVPYHYAVFIDVWKIETVAVNEITRCVQGSSCGDGIRNITLAKQCQCISSVVRDSGGAVEKGSI